MTDKNTPIGVPGRSSMSEIVSNARRERAGQAPEEVENTPVAADPEPESEEKEEGVELSSDFGNHNVEGEENSQTGDEEVEASQDEELVTIVVDGEEKQVPRDQVYQQGIRALQKESAADKRLAEAAERMKAATEYERRVQQQVEAQLRTKVREENDGEPLSKKQDEAIQAKARKIIDKILDGNEDEAATALAEAMSGRGNSTPAIDQNRLAQEVTQRVQRDLDVQAGIAALKESYPHIEKDAQLWNMADQETTRVQSEHPDWKPSQVILEAARRVDSWVKGVGGGGQKQSSDTPAPTGKEERKRTMEKIRTAASAKVPTEPEKRPPSRSEVVANMRKQRGLPGY